MIDISIIDYLLEIVCYMTFDHGKDSTGSDVNLNAGAIGKVGEMFPELSEFTRKPAEERAFILIRGFFDAADRKWDEGTEIPDEVSGAFHTWFNDPRNRQAKMRALKRVIEIERERTQKYRLFD